MNSPFDTTPLFESKDDAGHFAIFAPRAGYVATRIRGHFASAYAGKLQEVADREMLRGGFVGVHDWTLASSFDISVPTTLAAWTVSRLSRIARILIATSHPIVSLAVRTTNLTIKRIEHFDSVESLVSTASDELRRDPRSKPPTR